MEQTNKARQQSKTTKQNDKTKQESKTLQHRARQCMEVEQKTKQNNRNQGNR